MTERKAFLDAWRSTFVDKYLAIVSVSILVVRCPNGYWLEIQNNPDHLKHSLAYLVECVVVVLLITLFLSDLDGFSGPKYSTEVITLGFAVWFTLVAVLTYAFLRLFKAKHPSFSKTASAFYTANGFFLISLVSIAFLANLPQKFDSPVTIGIFILLFLPMTVIGFIGTYVVVIGVWRWISELNSISGPRTFAIAVLSQSAVIFLDIWVMPDF